MSGRLRLKRYLSNLKWLTISFSRLVEEAENWFEVLVYFVSPIHRSAITIRFRKGDALLVPRDYIFEAIAETLLLNVYKFQDLPSGSVIVDIGASVGDFTLLASRNQDVRVYAFEPSPQFFQYLQSNVVSNGRRAVRLFNGPADGHSLDSILDKYGEPSIDFLKVDCDGCEYKLFLECSPETIARIRMIAMEVDEAPRLSQKGIKDYLMREGFRVMEKHSFQGHYFYCSSAGI